MFRKAFTGMLAGALVLGAGGRAGAQDVQNFKPAVGVWNYLSVEGAGTAPQGRFVPSLYVNYGRNPLVLRDANDKIKEKIIENLATLDVLAAYGILDRLEIGADVPVSYVSGEALKASGNDGVGLGDIRLIPKYRLLGDTWGQGFGLAIAAPVSLPTGDKDKGIGADEVVVNPKLIAELRVGPFSAAADVGFRWRPDKKTIGTLEVGNEVTYGAGAGVELGSPDLIALGEVYGAAPAQSINDDSASKPLEGLLGLRIFTDIGAVLTFGAGRGLIADYGSPDFRLLAGLAWYHRPEKEAPVDVDSDGDGLVDRLDKCPNDPEDKDGFQDEEGCPDPDNDRDGIHDAQDKCPNEAEVINGVDDDDGCPDVGETKVKVTQEKIEILEQVFFDFDKATIKPESLSILNQVASVLKANPQITKVRVEGHTDRWGDKAHNMKLSQDRAQSVVDYLVSRGIEKDRLEPVGYGDTKPAVPYTEPGADAKNRRVVFAIVEQHEPDQPGAAPAPKPHDEDSPAPSGGAAPAPASGPAPAAPPVPVPEGGAAPAPASAAAPAPTPTPEAAPAPASAGDGAPPAKP
jgi:outer membrane protein OmpA-like peptidoglycan-associated protein